MLCKELDPLEYGITSANQPRCARNAVTGNYLTNVTLAYTVYFYALNVIVGRARYLCIFEMFPSVWLSY